MVDTRPNGKYRITATSYYGSQPIDVTYDADKIEIYEAAGRTEDYLAVYDCAGSYIIVTLNGGGVQRGSWTLEKIANFSCIPPIIPAGNVYDCGQYQITGNYRYGNAGGGAGGAFSIVVSFLRAEEKKGGSEGEYYFVYEQCDHSLGYIDNSFGGVSSTSLSVAKIGNCECDDRDGSPCADCCGELLAQARSITL